MQLKRHKSSTNPSSATNTGGGAIRVTKAVRGRTVPGKVSFRGMINQVKGRRKKS